MRGAGLPVHMRGFVIGMALARSDGPEKTCGLSAVPIFRALPEAVRAELAGMAQTRRFARNETIFPAHVPQDHVGCVTRGVLRLEKLLSDGQQQIIGILVASDMFGRMFDGPLGYAIEAATDAEVCLFRRGPFEALLERSPELEKLVILNILNEVDAALEWVGVLANRKVSARAASFLLMLCRRWAAQTGSLSLENGRIEVTVPLSRHDLALFLGTRPETLSRAFHSLAEDGLINIRSPYQFDIRDLDGLTRLSGQDYLSDTDPLLQLARAVSSR